MLEDPSQTGFILIVRHDGPTRRSEGLGVIVLADPSQTGFTLIVRHDGPTRRSEPLI